LEKLNNDQVSSQSIDHLGLVAATIHKLDLIQRIDKILPISKDKGAKLTMGQRVAGMIINGLGFVDTRLYMFPEFLANVAVDILIDDEVKSDYFTADALGRCLDEIHLYGVEKLFAELAYPIALEHGFLGDQLHIDSSSLTLHGDYNLSDEELESKPKPAEGCLSTPEIKRGHSKDHRPDLKQVVINMATTGAAGFPLWMESHSGNASDQNILHDSAVRVEAFIKSFDNGNQFIYVADSAAYSSCIKQTEKILWVSRVPERYSLVKKLLSLTDDSFNWEECENGYRTCNIGLIHKDVKQHWCIVSSEQARKREIQTFERRLSKIEIIANKQISSLGRQEFSCKQDALDAVAKLENKCKHHKIASTVVELKKYDSPGRPKLDSVPSEIVYKIQGTVSRDEEVISLIRLRKGRFIVATNDIKEEKVLINNLLTCYKGQASTESGFKFIKGNDFKVSSVYLKKPERIAALMVIMTLCLMVYSVAQYQLRIALKEAKETIPDQKGKETDNPTLSRIFRLFIGVQLLLIFSPDLEQSIVINVTPLRTKIIKLFGKRAMTIYGISSKSDGNSTK